MTKLVASLGSLEWIDGKAQKAGIFLDDKKKILYFDKGIKP